MTSESCRETMEQEEQQQPEQQQPESTGRVVARRSVFSSLMRGLLWPFGVLVRAFRRLWGVHGFQKLPERDSPGLGTSSPARPSLTARKQLRGVSRLLLFFLPRWAQASMGYPVFSSIGRALSPEVSISPTKLHGKGSKRKQDDLEDEDGEDEHPTWVEVLSQDLSDEGPEEDPDYEPSSTSTDSGEYSSHNSTINDLIISDGHVVIEDVNTDAVALPAETTCRED
uniref:Oogenesis-related protein n=1 Tax=Nothobranchius kuhntae TaxID=321403 RepID=A0A1A8HZJ0_NOTKU